MWFLKHTERINEPHSGSLGSLTHQNYPLTDSNFLDPKREKTKKRIKTKQNKNPVNYNFFVQDV